jgi:hypothetical protein
MVSLARGGAFARFLPCGIIFISLLGCGGNEADTSATISDSASSASSASGSESSASVPAPAAAGSGSAPSSSAPTISGSPLAQVGVGQAYSFTPTAGNAGGNTISFSIQNKPAWASFSIATGQLTGTPASASVGTYSNIIISVSNGTATSSLTNFAITVLASPPQSSPQSGEATLSWTPPTTNTNGTALADLAGYMINYGTNANALNQTVTIANATTTTFTLQDLAAGTWYFAIMAYTTDGSQSSLSNVVSTTIQ